MLLIKQSELIIAASSSPGGPVSAWGGLLPSSSRASEKNKCGARNVKSNLHAVKLFRLNSVSKSVSPSSVQQHDTRGAFVEDNNKSTSVRKWRSGQKKPQNSNHQKTPTFLPPEEKMVKRGPGLIVMRRWEKFWALFTQFNVPLLC